MMYLQSDMVVLNNLVLDDLDAFFEVAHDAEVRHYVPYAYCSNKSEALETLTCYVRYDDVNDYALAIRTPAGLVGVLLANRMPSTNTFEVCYFIKANQRRKGYATEALRLFINYLLAHGIYCDLFFEIRPKNVASKQVIKKLGIEPEDEFQEYYTYHV